MKPQSYDSDYPFIREISSPITKHQLRPLDRRCEVVQFSDPLTDRDFKKLSDFMRSYPNVELRIYGHDKTEPDLNFLRHFGFVRHLRLDAYTVQDFDGLAFASADLQSLGIGATKSKRHSLSFLERFRKLRTLQLEGQTKDIDVVGRLNKLGQLDLRSITLPDLSVLTPLKSLLSLSIKLGGTRNLELLARIGRLRYLELWRILGLSDVSAVAGVKTLQFLFLEALKNVKQLPSFAPLKKLRRVHLESMKGITDLRAVAAAPALEELFLGSMSSLKVEAIKPFRRHPALRRAWLDMGSWKKLRAAEGLLGLPDTAYVKADDFVFK